ncbi:calcium-binding protein [Sphingomonas sp. 1P06PA]|uniref:beta strand repeat-containing protein n=1 Tax=Sphingomonas sp. 1P06PA TaxID=554121 RepID=UPI0039A487F0
MRVQAEGDDGTLTGEASRYDDEGTIFIAGAGTTFDVRDLVSGVARGDRFEIAVLGTMAADTLTAEQASRPYYFNAGMGNDVVIGGTGDDFLVGGAGDDVLTGAEGNDSFIGGGGVDVINGAEGDDTAIQNVATDGVDFVNLGTGSDIVQLSGATQIRLTFTSAQVGNGNAVDSNTLANQDGGLAVRVAAEDADGNADINASRYDDEGVTFIAAAGTTFDVRDLVSGVERGDRFEIVVLGTSAADILTAVQSSRPYYFNAGLGNDVVTGGTANDFLVGGGGDDVLTGAEGNDSFIGGAGVDVISGAEGDDTAIQNLATDGVDFVNLGAGADIVQLSGASQIRLTFTSAEVGNGNAVDGGTGANQDGGLAVRVAAEEAGVASVNASRYDDEGITFVAAAGTTFDVRDLTSGVERGDTFEIVTLGTADADFMNAVSPSRSYYFNGGGGADVITGGDVADFLVGGAGNDTLSGGAGTDTFLGGAGNDTIDSVDRPSNIFGGSIAPERDIVDAGDGDDFVTGGKLDQLNGGAGNDFLLINFNFNGPEVGSGTPITLTLDGTGTGTASDGTSITGFESINLFLADTGDNVIDTGNVTASITAGAGNDRLTTGSGNDQLFGGAGDDVLTGGAGNDSFTGGAGVDVINGAEGDDTVNVNVATDGADFVNLGSGNDTVRFDRNDGGTGNIRITFTSSQAGNGSAVDSNSMANQDGGLAVRVQAEDADGNLTGLESRYDDEGITFVAGTQGITFDVRDLVSGAARGDTFEGVVLGTDGDDDLTFFPPFRVAQNFYYNAGAGDDVVTAGDGNDFLVGGSGVDLLIGGGGNDSYIVDVGADTIVELEDGGIDTVTANASYFLSANVENLILGGTAEVGTGNGGANTITGNASANTLRGADGDDTLIGLGGDDNLQGGAGNDTMIGGDGNDLYYVTDTGDVIVELAGGGTDTVVASVSYTLSAEIENATLTGGDAIDLGGNALGNRLFGNGAANVIDGGDGNDELYGLAGDDTLLGGAGDDLNRGGDGNDILDGGAGRDVHEGGLGADTFRLSSAADTGTTFDTADLIRDFNRLDGDRIDLSLVDANVNSDGDQAFSFIGNAAFSGTAGELRVEQSGGAQFVMGDTNGDSVADFLVTVIATTPVLPNLIVTDIVL